MIRGGVNLLHDVRRHVLEIIRRLAESGVDRQQKVFAKHSLDDVF